MIEQKVITITSIIDAKTGDVLETEYPKLNKYLEDGYLINDKIILTPAENTGGYIILFVLQKTTNSTVHL